MAVKIRKRRGEIVKQSPLILKRQESKLTRKSAALCTPNTNPIEHRETIAPITIPVSETCKVMFKVFKNIDIQKLYY